MSQLQVIGHSPGSKFSVPPSVSISTQGGRGRMRTDSLDSLGEEEEEEAVDGTTEDGNE